MDAIHIILGLQAALVMLVLWVLRMLFQVNEHLAKLNGRVREVETWKGGHEKQDDERYEAINSRFDRLREYMRERLT